MDFRTVISACQLTDNLDRDDLVILDCRFDLSDPAAGRQAWLEGHIPGALFADLDIDLSGPVAADTGRHPLPDVDVLTERLGRFGISTASQVVCYDQASGALAARAWWLLQWLGHERAAVLDGGFAGWLAGQGPVRVGEEACSAQTFRGQPADGWVLSTAEVAAAAGGTPGLRLLDAREGARFRGEFEPIDAVAGHIPGTKNLHFEKTLSADARLRTPGELKRLFLEILDGDLETPWSVMCGSGVTACQLALAAAHAGLRPPRLYVGSFSEWIRNPDHPVATGPGRAGRCAETAST